MGVVIGCFGIAFVCAVIMIGAVAITGYRYFCDVIMNDDDWGNDDDL